MRPALTTLANTLWLATNLPQSCAFHFSVRNVARLQERQLWQLLQRNAQTDYGRRYDFASLRSVEQYQTRVPLTSYDDYQSWMDRIAAGEPNVLTAAPVLLLEPTSGSTAATKVIPYTASLKAEFQRSIAAWIVDLFTHDPRLLGGQAYWSVTPATQSATRTPGGVPIGFEDDGEYLSRWQHKLLHSILAVPSLVRLIGEMEAFRYVTLLFLLRSRSLALISVWNPSFLSLLVERLPYYWTSLANDIAYGTISPPAQIEPSLLVCLQALNQPDKERAAEIEMAFRTAITPGNIHAQLWPQLRLISCWADAHAALYAAQLTQLFPQARVQGKGLLATEGFISFPLSSRTGAALALRSHFFEFIPTYQTLPRPLLAHELQIGARYTVVITTGGGLYRYCLHDVIEVVGSYHQCPLLRFIGKEDHIADWFGEKLNASHVEQVLTAALQQNHIAPTFAMMACETDGTSSAYTLFIEAPAAEDEALLKLCHEVETALRQNFHYRYCRELGQLVALRVFRIEGDAMESYLANCQARGQRAGDISLSHCTQAMAGHRCFKAGG